MEKKLTVGNKAAAIFVFLFGRVGALLCLLFVLLSVAIHRGPMAKNLVNHLQDIPLKVFNSVQQNASLGPYDYPWATHYFQDRILLAPQDPFPYASLGHIMMQLGEYRRSLKYYQKASVLAPDFWVFKYNQAIVLHRIGMDSRALEIIKPLFDGRTAWVLPGVICSQNGSLLDENVSKFIILKILGTVRQELKGAELEADLEDLFAQGTVYCSRFKTMQDNGRNAFAIY